MKKLIFFGLLLASGYKILTWMSPMHGRSDSDRAADHVIMESARTLGKRHHLRFIGMGGGAVDGITSMSISFQRLGLPLDRATARALIVDCADQFLHNINQDHELKKYLGMHPFPRERMGILIFNYDEKGYDVYDPVIRIVGISDGVIEYLTKAPGPGQEGRYETEVRETYEEAVAILRASSV